MKTKIKSLVILVLFFSNITMSCDNDLSPDNETLEVNTLQEQQKEASSVTLTQNEMILLEELSNFSNVFDLKREYTPDPSANNKLVTNPNTYSDRNYKYSVRVATNIYHN